MPWIQDDAGGTRWDGHEEIEHVLEQDEAHRLARHGSWFSWGRGVRVGVHVRKEETIMKVLATTIAIMATTPALATVRFSSGQSDPFVAVILSVIATVGLTLLIRFLLRRR
jgi:hypothetical protein